MDAATELQAVPKHASARILDEAHRRRRRTVHLRLDRPWLEEITPHPGAVLNRMRKRGLVYAAGEGRFVLAPPGTRSIAQAASPELLVDLLLRQYGRYYIGFLSALIGHRLTDLHSETIYAAVPEGTRLRGQAPLDVRFVQLSETAWPGEDEIERFRAVEGTKEFAYRASIERALVDGLVRPDLCAGFETVTTSWAHARRRPEVSWDRVAAIAERIGDAASRRTAFMLGLFDLDPVIERHFGDLEGRRTTTPLDRSNGYDLPEDQIERDPRTGIRLNVPRDYLRGWAESGNVG